MNKSLYIALNQTLHHLDSIRETPRGKALLAKLRQSVGRSVNEMSEIFSFVFERMPEECLGKKEFFSNEEQVFITVLQLYAIHQQGMSNSVLESSNHYNFGDSLRRLRQSQQDSSALDRRFNMMINSSSYEELTHNLRQLIKFLKSKLKYNSTVDYMILGQNLYGFLAFDDNQFRLLWSRSYYKLNNKGEQTNEN